MSTESTFLGLTRTQQLAVIGVVGLVLVVAGLVGSSAVDPEYDPLLFGVGVVALGYAVVVFLWDRVRSLLSSG